ncbi:MAG: C40 family peptidase [Paenibacillaceae bacterium]
MILVRRAAVLLLGMTLFFGSIGSVFADAPLNETIDDLLGIKYKYGGTTEKGFDCSGFTGYVFEQLGIDLPRTSRGQATVGTKIAKKDLRKGDLVFFNTNGKNISHVGIYLGNGKMAHSSSKYGSTIANFNDKYYVNRYITARRVLSEDQYMKFATEIEKNTETSTEIITHTEESEASDLEASEE